MENLTSRNGKFYRGSEIVPLEFGNIGQINLIERAKALREGIIFPFIFSRNRNETPKNEGKMSCLCGHNFKLTFEPDNIFICMKCAQGYKMYYYQDEIPCIKTIQKV